MGRGNHRKIELEGTPTKQAKSGKIFSTGSQQTISIGRYKTASIGSQKTATTRLSTESLGKRQQKEKLAKILAREATTMLATLSTSPKQKEK